jgi:Xaa-Pro aminopeptidase
MRYSPITPELFVENRKRLTGLLAPNALAVLNANDLLPLNADATLPLRQNSDLFYLTGVDQEETILLLHPDAPDEKMREILFLRETNPLIATWEGRKLTTEEARRATGIKNIQWLDQFPRVFHQVMCECEHVFLNTNEHKRAIVEVETRDSRFIRDCQKRYPLHHYQRLAPLMHSLRAVKSEPEIALIRKACDLTEKGFRRVLAFLKPGVSEMDVEAEFAHEFIRNGAAFAYTPIIAAGENACVLHYIQNDQPCKKGQMLLLDVGASYANYNSDMTRTIPVNGRFSRRQKQVYNAVLRILREISKRMVPGTLMKDLQKETEELTEKELVDLGLLKTSEIKKQDPEKPAFKKYFMHGIGHPLGLDVHDVGFTTQPIQPGWVLTCEPGIYIPQEKLGIRLENNILVTENGNENLMARIPIDPGEIEELMR